MKKTNDQAPAQVKSALKIASNLEQQAMKSRIQAGELLYKYGPARINSKIAKKWGVSPEYALVLVDIYLSDRARKVEGR